MLILRDLDSFGGGARGAEGGCRMAEQPKKVGVCGCRYVYLHRSDVVRFGERDVCFHAIRVDDTIQYVKKKWSSNLLLLYAIFILS